MLGEIDTENDRVLCAYKKSIKAEALELRMDCSKETPCAFEDAASMGPY
jgi:hypothetical protein